MDDFIYSIRMKSPIELREYEVAFCSEVKSWLDTLFATHSEWPFSIARIEQYGFGTNKRSDLRVFRKGSQTPVLAGEVKLPGTTEGRSPYDYDLMQEAFIKADNIQCPYFFTWNINTFVLFDRSKWQVSIIERRVKDWQLGLQLTAPVDCVRPEVISRIRDHFLPSIFAFFADIVDHRIVEWGMPPDLVFIHALESHLEWPVLGTRDHLIHAAAKDHLFGAQLQSWMSEEMNWTFDPSDPENWRDTVERAARTLCYVFCNRAIFYEAIRAKYSDHLAELKMPRFKPQNYQEIYNGFRNQFQMAVRESGDYEPIFYPQVEDWAGSLIFAAEMACLGWSGIFANLALYNFREIPYDIIGGIFQKLIAPEERQKFGQFYTNEDIIDIINAFCIRHASDTVIDPACGSGSFLIRAYHRKAWLSEQKSGGRKHRDTHKKHHELLQEIYGSDIALFAAHLATLNLASRQIEDEDNYPLIVRANFFDVVERRQSFCQIPGLRNSQGVRELRPVPLPDVDAVIGNPPYIRQENILRAANLKRQAGESKDAYDIRYKMTKEHLQTLCKHLWPGLKLSGRSDLHCYFWPVSAGLLKENGYFGFLTSSSWLDVEYGFAMQGWILKNFKLIAVIESLDEPWFPDARVKTAITILQHCNDESERMKNIVRFVRLLKPVKEILGERPDGDEAARQRAAENLRQRILKSTQSIANEQMRIILVPQAQLWEEGVGAGALVKSDPVTNDVDNDSDENDSSGVREAAAMYRIGADYVAGKWGRFLRAPNLYFRLINDYRNRFVRLGEIADVKFGIKSGCDAFFMPHDVTEEIMDQVVKGLPWNHVGVMTPCKRKEIESGKVRIIRAGDNTIHPIESIYLRPEVHSLMQVDRPVIRAANLDRVVLWVNQPLKSLRHTYIGKYLRWGAKQTFSSKKSKAVPVPQRSTCASRPLWYDLTKVDTGKLFWPMAHKYRHIAPQNPDRLVCNHNLFFINPPNLNPDESLVLIGILNCTLISLFKHFYGRYAGSEGTLKTEVIDTILLEIPDPRGVSPALAERFTKALTQISQREVTHLVEDALMQCHTEETMRMILRRNPIWPEELCQPDRRELDDCVFELIGVADRELRGQLIDELYRETTLYYRYQRTQDIQAMVDRSGKKNRRFSPHDLAESIWHTLTDIQKGPALIKWINSTYLEVELVEIPEGKAEALGVGDLFNPNGVTFRGNRESHHINYAHLEQASLVEDLAKIGISGQVALPKSTTDCSRCRQLIHERLEKARETYFQIAGTRTGNSALKEKTAALLFHWYVHGMNK